MNSVNKYQIEGDQYEQLGFFIRSKYVTNPLRMFFSENTVRSHCNIKQFIFNGNKTFEQFFIEIIIKLSTFQSLIKNDFTYYIDINMGSYN